MTSRAAAIIRADGSASIGMGHVMRGVAVAEGLAARGVSAIFVTRAGDDGAAPVLRAMGQDVEELDASGDEDARVTAKVAAAHGARLIVTDVCHWDALRDVAALRDYHAMLDADHVVVALTGGQLTDLPAALVVVPYVHVAETGDARRLLGPRYFIFRKAFVEAASRPRRIARDARRILVTLGGADPERLTPRVLRAVRALADDAVMVRVVIGPRFPRDSSEQIRAAAAPLGDRCTLLAHDADIAAAMLWADLAITADGFTRYETAVTGTPSVTLELASSDAAINAVFAAAGTTLAVPNAASLAVSELVALVDPLLRDPGRREAMSLCGKRLLDGRGLERLFAALPPGVLA